MADISHISIPSFNIDGDINDAIARTTINNHVADKNNPHNVTKAQIGLGNVDNTSDMDKPISTAVQNALDKKANNTLATESSPGLMSAEDKKAVDREFFKLVPRGATYVPHGADLRDNQYFKVGTYYHDWNPSEKEEERGIIYGMPGAGLHESPLAGAPFIMYVMAPFSDKYDDESTADEMTLERERIMIVDGGGESGGDGRTDGGGPIFIQGAFNRYKVVEGEGDWFTGDWTAIATELDVYFLKQYVNKHIYNKSNPHGVTKDQVGLGNVDNTADKDKSVKYANKAGYADGANFANHSGYADTANHVSWGNISGKPSTYPPSSHTHTKDQVGLDNVDNTADKDKSVKYAESAGSANSVAWDNVTGKPTTMASSVAWDDVTDKPSTYPPSSHTHTPDEVGLGNVANLDQSKAIKSITRSGTTFTATALDGTTTTFTQQDADTTSVTWDDVTDKPSTYPPDAHTHTPDQVGLGNVDNTADIDKPISTAVQKALDGKANTSVATSSTDGLMSKSDKAKLDSIEAGSNVESVNGKTGAVTLNKADIGLDNVDNTADKDKSVKYAESAGSVDSVAWKNVTDKPSTYPPSSHTHTPDQVGLGNVDNTADKDKSVKYAESAGTANSVAWDNVTGKPTTIASSVAWDDITDKPSTYPPDAHTHTPDQVGLGNVDNTADKDKSVKYAESAGTASSITWKNVSNKPSTYPPDAHTHTPSEVGLGNVDNTSDANKPISTAVQKALNNKVTKNNTADTNGLLNSLASEEITPTDADYYISQHAGGGTTTTTYHRRPMSALWAFIKSKCDSIYATVSALNTHISNKSNPHNVTKAQVGLGNVDNTSDANKPISTAVQKALDGKANNSVATSSADGLMSKSDKAKLDGIDPSAITTNAANIKKNADAISVRASLIPTGKAIYAGDDLNNISYTAVGTYYCSAIVEAQHISNLPEATAFMMTVYNPLGLLTGPLSTPWQYRVQEFMAYYGTKKYIRMVYTDGESNVFFGDWVGMTNSNDLSAVSSTINTHIANKSNPHGVTKAQVGLGNVDNTADSVKSVKYATSAGSAGTANSVAWGNVSGKPSTYPPDAHTHTKAQVGLGNVDNTSDMDKPISTAVQKALDGKANNSVATESSPGLMSAEDKKAVDREFFKLVPRGGTYIPPNADLNSIQYIKVGNYYNSLDGETQTMKNCPGGAFIMYVLAPLSEAYDDESAGEWVYRVRIFVEFTGNNIFVQSVSSATTVGSFSYGPWVKMTNSNDLGAVSDTINTHISNKSNPHNVTKAQVGLGNVDNTSDKDKSVKYATSADTVDGLHEYSFLRYRDDTSTNGTETLWNQIGIREYHGALPSGLSGVYDWGAVVSLPSNGARFDLYYNHISSSDGYGLYYRTGWGTDKKGWVHLIDSQSILDSTYPVGSIYMSVNSTSPASLFGGTWLPITNKFLFASGSVYAAGETGGEYNHTLTMDEVIQYGMWISDPATKYNSQMDLTFSPGSTYGFRTYNKSAVSHNNMPPYLVVYMWKRTA